ncbi:hypothetical protein [Sodalis sp. RH20]|uniref:hypothetical protein n=2 Tax=Sodalis TaxID=84565 RepID=UPI0039B40D49
MLMDIQSTPLAARRAPWPGLSRSSLNKGAIDTATLLGLLALRESHTDFAQHVFFKFSACSGLLKSMYFAAYS